MKIKADLIPGMSKKLQAKFDEIFYLPIEKQPLEISKLNQQERTAWRAWKIQKLEQQNTLSYFSKMKSNISSDEMAKFHEQYNLDEDNDASSEDSSLSDSSSMDNTPSSLSKDNSQKNKTPIHKL